MEDTAIKKENNIFQFLYPSGYNPYKIKWFDITIALALFLITFIAYMLTLTPSMGAGDNGELTTTLYNMGAGHPPGYPLYGILGKLFTYLPFGDIGYRVNIFVAVAGAGAIFFLYLLIVKLAGLNRDKGRISLDIHLPAIAASFLFAFSYSHWGQSTGGEVYPLNVFLVSFMLYIMVLWYEEIILFRGEENHHFAERMTLFLAFVMGLSLTDHMLPLWYIVAYFAVLLPFSIFIIFQAGSGRFKKEFSARMPGIVIMGFLFLISVLILMNFAIRNRLLYPLHMPMVLIGIFLVPAYISLYTIILKVKKSFGISTAAVVYGISVIAGIASFIAFSIFVNNNQIVPQTNQYLFGFSTADNSGLQQGMMQQTQIDPIIVILAALAVVVIFFFGVYDSVIKKSDIEYGWADKLIEILTYSGWLFIFAMTIYLYCMVRAIAIAPLPDPKPLSWGDTQTLDILLNHMLRKQYGLGGGNELINFTGQLKALLDFNIEQFGIINLVVAFIGLIYLFFKERVWAIFTFIAIVFLDVALIKFINFELDPRTVSFQEVFFIQQFFIAAVYAAFGYQLILDLCSNGISWYKKRIVNKTIK